MIETNEKHGQLNEKQLDAIQALADSPGYWSESDGHPKLLMIRLLSHIDVQQQELDELRARLADVEAERDRYRAELDLRMKRLSAALEGGDDGDD